MALLGDSWAGHSGESRGASLSGQQSALAACSCVCSLPEVQPACAPSSTCEWVWTCACAAWLAGKRLPRTFVRAR